MLKQEEIWSKLSDDKLALHLCSHMYHTCIHTCIYMYVRTHIHIMHTYKHTSHAYMHTYTQYVHNHTNIRIITHTYVHTPSHTHRKTPHTHISIMCIHKHTHTHTHTQCIRIYTLIHPPFADSAIKTSIHIVFIFTFPRCVWEVESHQK